MTKETLKALIARNIAGQGNAVDISGKLPAILDGVLDSMREIVPVKVKIKVYPKKWDDEWVADVQGTEGTVIIKGFDAFGGILPVREIPFKGAEDSEEAFIEVEVEAAQGDTLGVMAKIPGKGASCQFVQKVFSDTLFNIENYPAGMYEIGDGAINYTPGEDMYSGLAIITEDFACVIPPYQRAADNDYKRWGLMFAGIPAPSFATADDAVKDFDGALNSSAIRYAFTGDFAADAAVVATPGTNYATTQQFLPSVGILKYLYDHKAEINSFIEAETAAYEPEDDYFLIPNWDCWSSSIKDAAFAWLVSLGNGSVGDGYHNITMRVFAVSAFQTLY